jgi:hypothetical protein
MEKHHRNVHELVKTSRNLTKDTFLCEQNILNIVKKVTKETYKKHENDAKVFACGLKKTQMFCFIIKRLSQKLVENY